MNKLGTLTICPKCEYKVFSVIYIAPDTVSTPSGDVPVTKEYMKVECIRCGYSEKEYPLDSKDNIRDKQ